MSEVNYHENRETKMDKIEDYRKRAKDSAEQWCQLANEARMDGLDIFLRYYTTPEGNWAVCEPLIMKVIQPTESHT